MIQKGIEKTAQEQFYEVYEPLRKRYQLLSRIKASVFKPDEAIIEIYKDSGKDKKLICRSRGELEDCYKQMTLNLRGYEKRAKEKRAREALKFL